MELQLQELEQVISLKEKEFFYNSLDEHFNEFDLKPKHKRKKTVNLTFENTIINDLVNRLSLKYFNLTDLKFEYRLHKYVKDLEIPEHTDKTLFSLIYQFTDIPGFKFYYDNKWHDFCYDSNKILLCFDTKSEHYGFTPISHKFSNQTKFLRHSLTIHVDHDLDIR